MAYSTCVVCSQTCVVYKDITDRKINQITLKNESFTLCRECILKFMVGFVAALAAQGSERQMAESMRSAFIKTSIPPGM